MPLSQVRLALEVMFEGTKGDTDLAQITAIVSQEAGVSQSLNVGNAVTISYKAEERSYPAHVVLEWEGGSTSDMVADAVIAIILQVCTVAYGPTGEGNTLDTATYHWSRVEIGNMHNNLPGETACKC